MMENKNNMVPEEQLAQVAGGTSAGSRQLFEEGDLVKVVHVRGGSEVYNFGRVSDCEFDEELGEWTYQVEFGQYRGTMWVLTGYSDTYYPQSRLTRWSGDCGGGYSGLDVFGK